MRKVGRWSLTIFFLIFLLSWFITLLTPRFSKQIIRGDVEWNVSFGDGGFNFSRWHPYDALREKGQNKGFAFAGAWYQHYDNSRARRQDGTLCHATRYSGGISFFTLAALCGVYPLWYYGRRLRLKQRRGFEVTPSASILTTGLVVVIFSAKASAQWIQEVHAQVVNNASAGTTKAFLDWTLNNSNAVEKKSPHSTQFRSGNAINEAPAKSGMFRTAAYDNGGVVAVTPGVKADFFWKPNFASRPNVVPEGGTWWNNTGQIADMDFKGLEFVLTSPNPGGTIGVTVVSRTGAKIDNWSSKFLASTAGWGDPNLDHELWPEQPPIYSFWGEFHGNVQDGPFEGSFTIGSEKVPNGYSSTGGYSFARFWYGNGNFFEEDGYLYEDMNSIAIKWTNPIEGDATLDGRIDFADLAVLSQHYNQETSGGWSDGDFNFDGIVDFDDLTKVAQRYNTTYAMTGDGDPSLIVVEVPEPAAILAFGFMLLVCSRRR